jgi:hypothetical protein
VLSQDDGTSSSDRRAIECPKAGNVRKTRPTAGHPRHKGLAKCPRQRIHKLTTHSQRMIYWIGSPNGILLKKPFRAIILPQHRIPHQKRIRGLLLQALGDRCAHCRVLRTLPAFGHSIARRSLDEVPSS